MVRVIAIDLSSKPGVAVFEDSKLVYSTTIFNDKSTKDFGSYPYNYLEFARYTINKLFTSIQQQGYQWGKFDSIVLEETTAGRSNYSQKMLEFLHFALLDTLSNMKHKVVYIRSEIWKRLTGSSMSKEEKAMNAKIYRLKKKTGKKVVRKDEKGNKLRKVTRKDSYIRRANDLFGLSLERQDEDQAAACLLGKAFIEGAPLADGTLKGGLIKLPVKG